MNKIIVIHCFTISGVEDMKVVTHQYARKQTKWVINRFLRRKQIMNFDSKNDYLHVFNAVHYRQNN